MARKILYDDLNQLSTSKYFIQILIQFIVCVDETVVTIAEEPSIDQSQTLPSTDQDTTMITGNGQDTMAMTGQHHSISFYEIVLFKEYFPFLSIFVMAW